MREPRFTCRLVPVIEELSFANVFEHRPVDYYRYGEYPRYISPIVDRNRVKIEYVEGAEG
jgi:hypothetical protein